MYNIPPAPIHNVLFSFAPKNNESREKYMKGVCNLSELMDECSSATSKSSLDEALMETRPPFCCEYATSANGVRHEARSTILRNNDGSLFPNEIDEPRSIAKNKLMHYCSYVILFIY